MIKFVSIFFILVLFFSCKKDPTVILTQSANNASVNNDTMLPLAVGNYWIYQMSRDDSSGTYTMLNDIDSLYIEKDSIISGELYYKFKHSNIHGFMNYFSPGASFEHIWMKDSLGYLITYPRMIALDPVHLRDTVFRISDSSGVSGYACLVPDTFSNRNFILGQYSGLWMKGYSFYLPPYNLIWSGQHNFYAYSKNIGLLRMRFFFVSCPYLCRFSQHLIRYHLN
jgi:hypothetical protein